MNHFTGPHGEQDAFGNGANTQDHQINQVIGTTPQTLKQISSQCDVGNIARIRNHMATLAVLGFAQKHGAKWALTESAWVKFRAKSGPESTSPSPIASDIGNHDPKRIRTIVYRVLRETSVALRVKELHEHQCQICRHTITLANGSRYAEVHHMQPLGRPHDGPDVFSNVICVCPNHHAELDYGVRPIILTELRVVPGHDINAQYIVYHNVKNPHAPWDTTKHEN